MPPDVIARVHYYDVTAPKRAFYSSAQKDDYLGYIDKGVQSTKAIDYLDYTDDGEKSSGAFGAEGLLTKSQKRELREKLRATQSCIWDMVVSFEESYGKSNVTDIATARTVLRKTLPKLFRATGLNPDNMTWFAGLHTNTDNRHIHVCFLENEPQRFHRKTGTLRYRHGKIRQEALDTFKAEIVKHFMKPSEGVRRVRKLLTDKAQAVVSQPYTAYSFTLKRLVKSLYGKIPYEGKIGYESENMRHCRETVDAITNCILKNGRGKIAYERLTAELAAHDGEILRLCERNKIRNPDRYLYAETFQRDLYRRMGNIVIREILKKRRDELLKAHELRHAKARQKVYRESLTDCILTSMESAARADTEAAECFREFMEKLELAETERQLEQMEM